MTYPDYSTPGAPSLDPYYLTQAELEAIEAEHQRQDAERLAEAEAERIALDEDARWLREEMIGKELGA